MNFKELAEALGLEEEEYLELIELFIDTGMSDLDKLQSAIEKGNAEQAANAAHSPKGAASNLGFMKISETAREIGEKARNELLEGITEAAQIQKKKLEEIAGLARG